MASGRVVACAKVGPPQVAVTLTPRSGKPTHSECGPMNFPSREQFQAHDGAYPAWQAADKASGAMIEDLRRDRPVEPDRMATALREFDETHKAWMRAGEPLTWPSRR